MDQGTQEWLEFRKTRIGASDAAVIIGCSPWKTVYKLWQEKMGMSQTSPETYAMSYGKVMEPKIREWYEHETEEGFLPSVVIHPEYDWCMASLDGISADGKTILEVKTCGREVFAAAQNGIIPEYYKWQGHHQLACVPTAVHVEFVFYNKDCYARVILPRSANEIVKLIEMEKDFYEIHMVGCVATEITEKDYVDFREAWEKIEERSKDAYDKYKVSEGIWKQEKAELIDKSDDGNGIGNFFMITRSYPKGGVDLDKMKDDGIDIEKYRKPTSVKVTIKRLKEKNNE